MQLFSKAYEKTDSNTVKLGDVITCDHTFQKVIVTQIISITVEKDFIYILGNGMGYNYIEPNDDNYIRCEL